MRTRRSAIIAAAFDRGQIPAIACFNQATVPLGGGLGFDKLIATLQQFLDQIFVPVWGTPARLVRTTGFQKGAWALAFLDTADVANALGYHDLTPDGLPLSKVFVRTTLGAGQKVSVTASHELAEMLVDPAINARFEIFRKPGSTQFDHLKRVTRPFQILPGGYMSVFQSGKWTQVFGSKAKAARFAREDRRGHRSMYRGRPDRMKPSRPTARASTKRRPQSR